MLNVKSYARPKRFYSSYIYCIFFTHNSLQSLLNHLWKWMEPARLIKTSNRKTTHIVIASDRTPMTKRCAPEPARFHIFVPNFKAFRGEKLNIFRFFIAKVNILAITARKSSQQSSPCVSFKNLHILSQSHLKSLLQVITKKDCTNKRNTLALIAD